MRQALRLQWASCVRADEGFAVESQASGSGGRGHEAAAVQDACFPVLPGELRMAQQEAGWARIKPEDIIS